MKSDLQAKYLQFLSSKKNKEEGFTLIELLVVVIIIGVLAAVALPNLLGQVGKAREGEARNNLGAMNRAQQSQRTENGVFVSSGDATTLEIPIGDAKYYNFSILAAGVQHGDAKDVAKDSTRDYIGGVSYNTADRSFGSVVCRATNGPDYTLTAAVAGNAGDVTSGKVACSGTSSEVK